MLIRVERFNIEVLLRPFRLVKHVLDALDERRARRLRDEFGRRLWLLSWHQQPDRRWRARLSGPGLVCTIERSARTRRRAIGRTARAMSRIMAHQARTEPAGVRCPDPPSQ
jgi:hypothetical protein